MSYQDYLQDCWNQANPDEDDRTHEVVSVYCSSAGAVVVAGDRLIHLAQK
jgi:hypothetical protein